MRAWSKECNLFQLLRKVLHLDDKIDESSFLSKDNVEYISEYPQIGNWHIKPMTLSKIGGPKFEVERFDDRTNYLLLEPQVKNVIK